MAARRGLRRDDERDILRGAELSMMQRPLPHSLEAERACLGGLLISPELVDEIIDRLDPEDFFRVAHRHVVNAVRDLTMKGVRFDLVTVKDWLATKNVLSDVGGPSYLAAMTDGVPRASNVAHYLDVVRQKAVLRRIQIGSAALINAIHEGEPFEEVQAQADKFIADTMLSGVNGFIGADQMATEGYAKIAQLVENRNIVTGVTTGYLDLDGMLRGFQPGHLVIVAARPSVGKTALLMNMAASIAKSDATVAAFSLEMDREELFMRLLASEANIDAQRLQSGFIADSAMADVGEAVSTIGGSRLFVDDTPILSPLDARLRIKRLRSRVGQIDVVFIDYLQLMQPSQRKFGVSRQEEVASISRELKLLARELKVPVVVAAQLNRALEGRKDKRPQLSDLRESGAIEQDADDVLFIHRDEELVDSQEFSGVTEIIIGKQRNGPTGTVQLMWNKEVMRFDNLDTASVDEYRRYQREQRQSRRRTKPLPPMSQVKSFTEPEGDED